LSDISATISQGESQITTGTPKCSTPIATTRRLRDTELVEMTEFENRMVNIGETSETREFHRRLTTESTTIKVTYGTQTKEQTGAASKALEQGVELSNLNAEASISGLAAATTTTSGVTEPNVTDHHADSSDGESESNGATATALVATSALAALVLLAGIGIAV
jgi:hypothetical protein